MSEAVGAELAEHSRASSSAGAPRTVELASTADGRTVALTLELDRGHHYRILAEGKLRASLCAQLCAKGLAAVVSPDSGLLGNLRVWENLILPLEWHGAQREDLWHRVRSILEQLSFSDDEGQRLCQAMPEALPPFEARAAVFTRGLLLAPEIMVFDRLFAGLGRQESQRAATFQDVFQATYPVRTAVSFEEHDSPFAPTLHAHIHDLRESP